MSKDGALALATGTPSGTPGLQPAPDAPAAPSKLDSERFAQLAKRETEFVKKQQQLKAEREAFLAERDQFKPIADQYKHYQETKAKDPVAALKIMGFSETDIINYLAAEGKAEPTEAEKAAIAAREAAQAEIKAFQDAQAKEKSEAQKAADTRVIQAFRSEMTKIVTADPSKFEYCAHYGPAAEELAYEFALEVVKQSKGAEVITAQEAMEMVEEYYEEQDKAMSTLKKRQPKDTPAPETPPAKERTRTVTPGHPNAEQPKAPITHTRGLANGATSPMSARQRMNETREQKRERLMEALRNGVKP